MASKKDVAVLLFAKTDPALIAASRNVTQVDTLVLEAVGGGETIAGNEKGRLGNAAYVCGDDGGSVGVRPLLAPLSSMTGISPI
jgi:hypothetical protein